jgi:metal-responsive CopG/Arc/MetJ family transcriptional regulator
MTVAKVAVTVPEDTLRAVERRRRVLGMSRSAVVSVALESWLADQAMTAEERRYVVSYLKRPETAAEVRETTTLGAAAMAAWEPWSEAPAKRPTSKARRSKAKR